MPVRARKFKDREFNFMIVDNHRPIKIYPTLEMNKNCILANGHLAFGNTLLKKTNAELDELKKHFTNDEDYLDIIANNSLEKIISDKYFNQDIIERMMYNHKLKLTYNCNSEKKNYDNEIFNQSISRTEKEINDLAECELISKIQDNEIQERMNRRKNIESFDIDIDKQIKEIQESPLPLTKESFDRIEIFKK